MKKRLLILTVLCAVLLLTLTGCSNAKNTMSSTASKIKDDVSDAMSKVESFFEGDDTLSSRLDDDFGSSGLLDDDWGSSGLLDDDWGSSALTDDTSSGVTTTESE